MMAINQRTVTTDCKKSLSQTVHCKLKNIYFVWRHEPITVGQRSATKTAILPFLQTHFKDGSSEVHGVL